MAEIESHGTDGTKGSFKGKMNKAHSLMAEYYMGLQHCGKDVKIDYSILILSFKMDGVIRTIFTDPSFTELEALSAHYPDVLGELLQKRKNR